MPCLPLEAPQIPTLQAPHPFFPTEALLTAMPPSLCCLRLALRRFACPPPDSGCLPLYGAGACALLGPSPTLVRGPESERNHVISSNCHGIYGAITSSPCSLAVRRSFSSPGPGDLSIFPICLPAFSLFSECSPLSGAGLAYNRSSINECWKR